MLKYFEDLGWQNVTSWSRGPQLLHVKQNSLEISYSTKSLSQKLLLIPKPVRRKKEKKKERVPVQFLTSFKRKVNELDMKS